VWCGWSVKTNILRDMRNYKSLHFLLLQDQTLPGFYNARDRLGVINYDEIITDHKSRVLPSNRRASILEPSPLPKITLQSLGG
jgi:hypothetical protein